MADTLLSIREVITHADSRTFRGHPFTVGPDVGALHLDFHVEPRAVGPYEQSIKVALFDPNGSRGLPGRGMLPARLTPREATPGLLPGPLTPGTWTAEVCLDHVLDGPPCTYQLDVWAETEAGAARAAEDHPSPLVSPALPLGVSSAGPRWYAGDLHMHTVHSDGRWTTAQLLAAVRRRGLDFFALTDHNTQSALRELAAADLAGLLALPGVEVTTNAGHLLAIGVERPIDWRLGAGRGGAIDAIVRDVHDAGGLAIIAHPGSLGSPVCHGCAWELTDVAPAQIDAVEAWNGPWRGEDADENERSLLFWREWLGRCYRTPASGGSDAHGPGADFEAGVPTLQVYAPELSRAAILEAIRAGRTVVTSGPTLRLSAVRDGDAYTVGDTLAAAGPVTLEAEVSALGEPARLRLLCNGAVIAEQQLDGEGGCAHTSEQPVPGWYAAEVRSADTARLLALTSPLYVAAP